MDAQDPDNGFPLLGTGNPAESSRLVDYDSFIVQMGINPAAGYILTVLNDKPPSHYTFELQPVRYAAQPDYWRIEVMAHAIGINPNELRGCFPLSLNLTHTMGKKGIEVVGATKMEKWDLPD